MNNLPILIGVLIAYAVSFVLFVVNFLQSRESAKQLANWTLYLGFFLASSFIFSESRRLGFYLPITNFSQALFFFAWSMVFIYLVLGWQLRLGTFGLVLVPLVFLISAVSLFFYRDTATVLSYLTDKKFLVHVLGAFFAYASFALSFVGALLYLLQNSELKGKKAGTFYHKLPSLEALEGIVFRTIIVGYPLLTVGLVSGFLWSRDVYGVFWSWDPKFIFSSFTWLLYSGILYARYINAFHGKKLVVMSILAFGLVLFTFLGVNLFGSNTHDFLK